MHIDYLADHPQLVHELAPAIWQHWREVLPEDSTVEHRAAKLRKHMRNTELPLALVAHANGKALGTAALREHDLEGREDLSPWLGGVFVLPQYRRQGVASALCTATKAQAHSMGYSVIYLFTIDHQRLYERLGWRSIDSASWKGLSGCIMNISTAA